MVPLEEIMETVVKYHKSYSCKRSDVVFVKILSFCTKLLFY
jgi:hypothetical protein